MADNFQVPSTLPDGDPGVNIHALERTVNAATVKVGVSVTVDPTDPTKRQAVDSTYGAAVDVTRSALPPDAATASAQSTGNASLASIDGKAPALVGGRVPVGTSGLSQDVDDTAPPNRAAAESAETRLATDRDGALFVRPYGPQVWSYHEDSSSALTGATVHAAPGAGLSLYVTDIVISTGAATALNAFLSEGATKVLGPFYLEAAAGRGIVLRFATPKKITPNTALTITTSAAIAHSIDITGFTAQG